MADRVLASLNLPMAVDDFVAMTRALTGRYPEARCRGVGDGTTVVIVVAEDLPPGLPVEQGRASS